jgi:methylmalonyl-CoA mutase
MALTILDDFPPVSPDQWRAVVDKDLKGAPFDKKLLTPLYDSGVTLQPIYTRDDAIDASAATRGLHGLGSDGWAICQPYTSLDPAAANRDLLADLKGGCTAFELCLHQRARNRAANSDPTDGGGIFINTSADLATALNGVHLDAVEGTVDAGAGFLAAAALLVTHWQQQGTDLSAMRGSFGADPLSVLANAGALPGSLDGHLADLADLAAYTASELPQMRAVTVSGQPYHEAGASTSQELAAIAATIIAYMRAMTAAGMDAASAAKQIVLRVPVGCRQFEDIAKLRAVRSLWARIIDVCQAGDIAPTIHAVTSQRMLSQRDPWVNILRTTVAGFSAAVAGADSISITPFDARLGDSDGLARRIARNIQVILAEESNLDKVLDPAGGSWYVERLTADLANAAWSNLQTIEANGGIAAVLADGSLAKQINATHAKRAANIAKRKDPLTGISEFPNLSEKPVLRPTGDPATVQAAVAANLGGGDPNLVAAIPDAANRTAAAVQAAHSGATLGAISASVLRGAPASAPPLTPIHLADGFERLRDASDAHLNAHGTRPQVFLATLGPVAQHTARVTFSRNFAEAGGFAVTTGEVDAFKSSGARIAILCSSDALYLEQATAAATRLKTAGATRVVLAGRIPAEHAEAWHAAGIDEAIGLGAPVLDILTDWLTAEGVLA